MLTHYSQSVRKYFPRTCLIVEDSEFDREKLSRIVRHTRSDMHIETAATLQAAREKIDRGDIAIILLDNNLPDGIGADFALELSEEKHLAEIPVVMVSDWPSPFMWQKAARAGVSYVLSKSEFDGHYLRAALEGEVKQRVS